MLKIATFVLLLTNAVLSDCFIFPDELPSRVNHGSRYSGDGDRGHLNSYDNDFTNQGSHHSFDGGNRHESAFDKHSNGNQGGFVPGFGNHHSHSNRVHRQERPYYGGIVSQSEANAQSQAQSQGYQGPLYPFGPSGGGSGASSASSAASATSGIVNGVASASAAAASASSGGGGSVSSSSSSSSSSGSNVGFGNGNSPWFFRSRVAGEDGSNDKASSNNDELIFSQK